MKFEIQTLALIQSLTFIAQVVALYVQYRVNRIYRGIGWWVLGSTLIAFGAIFMPLVTVKSLLILAMIANPLVVLGQIFLYVGVMKFLDKRVNKWALSLIYAVFIVLYYNYIFGYNDISSRTVVVNSTIVVVTMMTAFKLFAKKGDIISVSANFTATAFLLYGGLAIIRASLAFLLPPMQTYSDQEMSIMAAFIVPTIASTLWTFGFIIMLNQRLNTENLLEKEKMQLFFNTNPDAAMITRLDDGLFIDVNEGFSRITGYTHDEVIGDFSIKTKLWHHLEDRQNFLAQLKEKGICENREFVFGRKDGSEFVGITAARIISIHDVPHIIATIHDITERKLAEQEIQLLVQQLEIERNDARLNSITDSLTGIANRRYFDEVLEKEFYRLKRSGLQLSLIMLDVDYFKKYNDTYGHIAGDHCLRQIGNMLQTIVERTTDVVARYGGEEFVVILPETEVSGAKVLAERIGKAMEELAIPHSESDVSKWVTVSMGVVTASVTELESPEQVVTLVDEAMYRAKKAGRNRIEVATYDMEKLIKQVEKDKLL